MNGRKWAHKNFSFAYVIVAKFHESIPDYSFPLIYYLFLLLAYILLRHWNIRVVIVRRARGGEGIEGEGMGWDVMLFAKNHIFIVLNIFVWISQLCVLL